MTPDIPSACDGTVRLEQYGCVLKRTASCRRKGCRYNTNPEVDVTTTSIPVDKKAFDYVLDRSVQQHGRRCMKRQAKNACFN